MRDNLQWVAGILEGEGCWSYNTSTNAMRITCIMVDEDILARVQAVVGGTLHGPYLHSQGKPTYQLGINKQAEVRKVTADLYPYLGSRRKDQIAHMHIQYMGADIKRRK